MNYNERSQVVNSGGGSWQARESDNHRDSRENEDESIQEHMADPPFVNYLNKHHKCTHDFSNKTMMEIWDNYLADTKEDNEG